MERPTSADLQTQERLLAFSRDMSSHKRLFRVFLLSFGGKKMSQARDHRANSVKPGAYNSWMAGRELLAGIESPEGV